MPDSIQLIVGLGNPGEKYTGTRHNAGFWFVDELLRRHGGSLRLDARYGGEVGRLTLEGRDVHALKPLVFMNRSGQSVGALARFFKIEPESILVAHDELDLPAGTVRLKRGGGHGGHNGLRDICRALGSRDFFRLRVGIDHPGPGNDVVGYVLGRPSPEDRRAIEQALEQAAATMPLILGGELDKAMQILHTKVS